jgi:hypothetical protein
MTEEIKTIELKYPIPVKTSEGETAQANVLKLGRFKAKHLKLLPKGLNSENASNIDPQDMIPIIAGITGIPIESAEELDIRDLMRIAEDMESFLSESLETGKN